MSRLCNSEGHGVAKAGNQDAALSHAFSFPDHTKCKILIQMRSPGILQTLKIFPPVSLSATPNQTFSLKIHLAHHSASLSCRICN